MDVLAAASSSTPLKEPEPPRTAAVVKTKKRSKPKPKKPLNFVGVRAPDDTTAPKLWLAEKRDRTAENFAALPRDQRRQLIEHYHQHPNRRQRPKKIAETRRPFMPDNNAWKKLPYHTQIELIEKNDALLQDEADARAKLARDKKDEKKRQLQRRRQKVAAKKKEEQERQKRERVTAQQQREMRNTPDLFGDAGTENAQPGAPTKRKRGRQSMIEQVRNSIATQPLPQRQVQDLLLRIKTAVATLNNSSNGGNGAFFYTGPTTDLPLPADTGRPRASPQAAQHMLFASPTRCESLIN